MPWTRPGINDNTGRVCVLCLNNFPHMSHRHRPCCSPCLNVASVKFGINQHGLDSHRTGRVSPNHHTRLSNTGHVAEPCWYTASAKIYQLITQGITNEHGSCLLQLPHMGLTTRGVPQQLDPVLNQGLRWARWWALALGRLSLLKWTLNKNLN